MNISATISPARSRLLDRPIWSALTTANAELSEGGAQALRFQPEVAPFAAVAEETPAAFAALAALVAGGERAALLSPGSLAPLSAFEKERQGSIVQMVLDRPVPADSATEPDHVVLGAADVAEMLDLTARTRPGPFGRRTIEFGQYLGIRIDGALAAMAGERMRFDRFIEISAVCVDPAHRGKGYAALLMMRLARRMQENGLTPFLHVFADNLGAIALYEKLGFRRRSTMQLTVLLRR